MTMRSLLTVLLCLVALPLQAAFEFDYPARTMRDTSTGLVWSDLAPRGAMDPATGVVAGRWRVATTGEVEALFGSLGAVAPAPYDVHIAEVFAFLAAATPPPQPPAAIRVLGIAGPTATPPSASCLGGIVREYGPIEAGWRIVEPVRPPAECLTFDPAARTFLVEAVRPVPAPSSSAALLAGLCGLAVATWRHRRGARSAA